jgi:hypothetical protein
MKRFRLAAKPCRIDVTGIADSPLLSEISYDEFDSDYESDDSLDLGMAEGKAPISSKETEFSLNQYAKWMGQPNLSAFNRWKIIRVTGFLHKKHLCIILGQNRLKQQRGGPLHWETAVADCLQTIEKWLPLENFYNAEWIW